MRRWLYRNFRALSALEFSIQRRFTKAGFLLLAGLGASAVVGIDTNRTVGYQSFAFLVCLLAIAMVSGLRFHAPFTVQRLLPRFATVGEPLAYRLVVRNDGPTPQHGLALFENLADPRPSFEEFVQAREPGEERRNWFDRRVGYPRWSWLVERKRGAIIKEQPLPALPPGGRSELRPEIVPRRRGHLRFTGATIARPDPFGVFRALVTVPVPESVLVLPRRYPMPRVELPGTRKYQHGGVALASSVGDSEEFVSLRDYRPGDPLRRIHWKSWARAGKPVVKEYQDEFFVRHALVLDTFVDREPSDIFEEAVSVAASVACSIQTQESLLDLMFVGPEAYCFTAGRGLAHTDRMLEILACVQACRDKPFSALRHSVLARCQTLSGCVCVLLAWDDERRDFVGALAALGMPTLVFVVTEPGAAFEPAPGVHRLDVGKIAEGLARL